MERAAAEQIGLQRNPGLQVAAAEIAAGIEAAATAAIAASRRACFSLASSQMATAKPMISEHTTAVVAINASLLR